MYLSFVDKDSHEELANNILSLSDYKWVTTYDIKDKILELYKDESKAYTYSLLYSVRNKRRAKEYLFVGNNTLVDCYDKVKLTKV